VTEVRTYPTCLSDTHHQKEKRRRLEKDMLVGPTRPSLLALIFSPKPSLFCTSRDRDKQTPSLSPSHSTGKGILLLIPTYYPLLHFILQERDRRLAREQTPVEIETSKPPLSPSHSTGKGILLLIPTYYPLLHFILQERDRRIAREQTPLEIETSKQQ
jgi:hypothetical protein